MPRLPNPGGDSGAWGGILNDFLAVEHNTDGTLKQSDAISGAVQSSDIGQPSGIASLGATGLVPTTQLGGSGASGSTFLRGDQTWVTPPGMSDATASSKGIVQLAGDLAGTASAPTVPGLSSKVNTSRVITAGTGLSGGGDLSADRTMSVDADSTVQRVELAKAGTLIGSRKRINLIEGSNVTLTTADNAGSNQVDVTVSATASSADGSAATFTVAANDSPAASKNSATYVCTGTNDHVTLQTAHDDLPAAGGDIFIETGDYIFGGTLNITKNSVRLIFAGGATFKWTAVTGTTPILQIKASKVDLINPRCQGSGAKGNGTGILLVTDTTGCHDVYIEAPELLNLDTGIEYGIVGGNSTGDCATFGGAIHDCKTGIKNKGFTNRAFGSRIYNCDICVDCTNDRTSQKFEGYGLTISQWAQQAIRIRSGQGSVFENTWLEHTNASLAATEAILIGGSTVLGDTNNREVLGVSFRGTTKLTLATETYAFRLYNCRDLLVENLVVSTNGTPPTGAVVRTESTLVGNNNRFKCIALMPGSGGKNIFPGYPYPVVLSDAGGAGSEVIVEQHYDVENTNAGTTIGGRVAANPAFTYTVFRESGNGSSYSTYYAKKANGHIATFAADTATPVSGLRAVLNTLVADNTSLYFPAGTYSFPEDPAGVEDHWAPSGYSGLAIEGDPSRGTILSNWRDDSQSGYDPNPDAEPFSFTRCHDLVYRNFRIWAGGNQDANNSSDATDFDSCRGTKLENLIIERSRARGIVYDGGDKGAVSQRSHIKNCEIRGVPTPPNVYSGGAGTLTAQEYRYAVTYIDSIFGETPPSDYTAYVASGTAQARLKIATGPYYDATRGVIARKVYRWSTAQQTYRLLVTINDNTTTIYDDDATDASISAGAVVPTAGTPLIPKEGIKLLGAQRHLVAHNEVIGVGSHGIQIVRKGSDASTNVNSDGHRVIANTVRFAGVGASVSAIAGIYVGGGSFNDINNNNVSDVGSVANQGYGMYVQGLVGGTTEYNLVGPNTIYDDQSANTPSGGASTKYGIQINTVASGTHPDNTVISPSSIKGMVTVSINDATGTNTRQYSETTHTHSGPGFAAQVSPLWKTGLYYGARSSMAHGSLAGQALTANQAYAAPVYVPADKTVTTIACDVATALAGSVIRMGIYDASTSDGRPTTLVSGSETGNISAATTGVKSATISAALLGGYWYWLVVVSDNTPSLTGFTGGQPNFMGSVSPSSGTKQSAVRASIGAGWASLPTNYPASPSETATTLTVEVTF